MFRIRIDCTDGEPMVLVGLLLISHWLADPDRFGKHQALL